MLKDHVYEHSYELIDHIKHILYHHLYLDSESVFLSDEEFNEVTELIKQYTKLIDMFDEVILYKVSDRKDDRYWITDRDRIYSGAIQQSIILFDRFSEYKNMRKRKELDNETESKQAVET